MDWDRAVPVIPGVAPMSSTGFPAMAEPRGGREAQSTIFFMTPIVSLDGCRPGSARIPRAPHGASRWLPHSLEAFMRTAAFHLTLLLSVLAVGACADDSAEEPEQAPAAAPAPAPTVSLADFAGTWDAVSYLESGDTVRYQMVATADPSGWMLHLPDRDPMPMRVVSVAGDSVVTEAGPYESILRQGVQVTVQTVGRLQDGRMVGTMEARYQSAAADSIVRGRIEATKGM